MEYISDAEFIETFQTLKSPKLVSDALGLTIRHVNTRRRALEMRHKIKLEADHPRAKLHEHRQTAHAHEHRLGLGLRDGIVIVFSDAHFWPGLRSTAFKGLLWAIQEFQPKAIINNGDAFDGAAISRHPRIGWDEKPTVINELEACSHALSEIEAVAPAKSKLIWALGNHDARFENRLANTAGEFQGVKGFSLADHFDRWKLCWSCWPTDDLVVKHRYKGGIHATHNNTVGGGKSMVTGHLHSLKVTPYSDYNGTRFGVDTGTLADIDGPQFRDYLEDSPVSWRSGFAILTLHKGVLLWPELVHTFAPGFIEFRGKVINVSRK